MQTKPSNVNANSYSTQNDVSNSQTYQPQRPSSQQSNIADPFGNSNGQKSMQFQQDMNFRYTVPSNVTQTSNYPTIQNVHSVPHSVMMNNIMVPSSSSQNSTLMPMQKQNPLSSNPFNAAPSTNLYAQTVYSNKPGNDYSNQVNFATSNPSVKQQEMNYSAFNNPFQQPASNAENRKSNNPFEQQQPAFWK